MADDSLEVQKEDIPFHPCHTPRGMTWYNLDDLTPLQQKLLDELKIDVVKENNQYLARHPEIRAIISILLQAILKEQPKLKSISDFAKDFFISMTREQLQTKIDHYLAKKGEPFDKTGDSALDVVADFPEIRSSEEDLSSLYRKDYYTWITYTTESSLEEECFLEWTSSETEKSLLIESETETYASTSQTETTYKDTTQKEIDLLFASMAISQTAEQSIEDASVDMSKEILDYLGATPTSAEPAQVPQAAGEEEIEGEIEDEIEDEYIEEEIRLSEEIEKKLSIIMENLQEEEDEDNYYEDIMDKRSIIEMDLESLKEKQSTIEGEEDVYEEEYKRHSAILETLLNYEMNSGG